MQNKNNNNNINQVKRFKGRVNKPDIFTVCENGDWEMFQVLISNGENMNQIKINGTTSLHYASQSGNMNSGCEVKRLLI